MDTQTSYFGKRNPFTVGTFKSFDHSFEFFEMWRYKSDEYKFHAGRKYKVPTAYVNTLDLENMYESVEMIKVNEHVAIKGVVKEEAVERFHPNKIDNKAFWQRARKGFPLLSVCSGECRSVKKANEMTLVMSMNLKLFPFLLDLIEKSKEGLMVLEIGFGYGNVFNKIKDKCKYLGIDYIIPRNLRKHTINFIEIDKSGIPDFLLDTKVFDVVYAVNVLQHCSQKDRFEYFEQAYSVLKPGGYMLFSCVIMNKDNKDEYYWGVKDKSGRGYLMFFNQLTEVDRDYELFNKLQSIGFIPVTGGISNNNMGIIMQKPK
jgi:SAM-dependent methyltransferase